MKIIGKMDNEEVQQEMVHIARASITKKKLIRFLLVFALFAIIITFAWIYGRNQAAKDAEAEMAELQALLQEQENRIQELIETPIVVNPVAPEINLGMIYSEINDIGELATVEYLFTDAAKFSDSKQINDWEIPFTEKSFTLKWDGVIKAGVALDNISIDVNKEEMKIIVSVPQAEILSYEIDHDSVELLDEQNNIFNNISTSDKIKFDAATEKAMKERAIENGILEKAQTNAENIINRLLTANEAIGSDYVIEFVVLDQTD